MKYDLIILGGGPGGYEAARLAGIKGIRTLLIEERNLGGTCLNRGCIPLKVFLHIAKIKENYETIVKNGFVQGQDIEPFMTKISSYKEIAVDGLRRGVVGMEKRAGVEVLYGHGVIEKSTDDNFGISVGNDFYEFDNLVISTGSDDIKLPYSIDSLPYKVVTSEEFLNINEIPQKVVVIGGGVIGIETASFFNMMGSQVTIIETLSHIGGGLDDDVADSFAKILKRKGIKILTDTNVQGFKHEGVDIGNGVIETDFVLIAIGRSPCVNAIGLDATGIKYSTKGIDVDNHCKTNISNIYACGDVTGKMMLAHVAYAQARIIIKDIIGKSDAGIDYGKVPKIIYSSPEIISVGKTEKVCKDSGIEYEARTLPLTYNGRYFAEHGKDGAFGKIIISNEKLLGITLVGNDISEIAIVSEMMMGMKLGDIDRLVFPHPTVGEIIHNLCGDNL